MSLVAVEDVNVRLLPQLCALLLTRGSVKDAVQTFAYVDGRRRTAPAAGEAARGEPAKERNSWFGGTLLALALGGVSQWPKGAESKAQAELSRERDARKRKRQQQAKLAQQQFSEGRQQDQR